MSLCEEHCALLDLLQLCPVTLHDILYSLDYLDLTACDNHTLPQPPLATPPPSPQHVCLPDPILTSDTEGSGEDLYSDCECVGVGARVSYRGGHSGNSPQILMPDSYI